ncbi:hypothetical protein SAMN05421788_104270 [Filimonas lacunae]|uniref:TIGR01777 family protein n=1 Tax=Filimonas lacunae TaxID=477680 RepID=A0A173MSB7_9BACT|nr:TIGR01777 family oxidoreductase [Filimonas lacunae]BAV10359.1 cell division inhibitor [Filimonas lacunae]SIT16697.1 hypothetical protein SAMN05421788_104270 [Filimonas lacunae]
MSTVLITGGTGLVGSRLTKLLVQKGYEVIVLTRNPDARPAKPSVTYKHWDVEKGVIDKDAVAAADFLIHLAGEGVADKRWSKQRKEAIVSSRVKSGELLLKAVQQHNTRLQTVVSASGIGWYGPDAKEKRKQPVPFVESDSASADFLGETCRLWEESVQPFKALGKRLVILRTGLALSNQGGFLLEIKKPLQMANIATIMGGGEQVVSWIHIDDLCRMYLFALENAQVEGVYNAVAPAPLTNKAITLLIANHRKPKPFIPIHVPAFVLKIVIGEMSVEVLKSATVSAAHIKETGFHFLYPSADAAIEQLQAEAASA